MSTGVTFVCGEECCCAWVYKLSAQVLAFISWRCRSRGGVVESYGNCMGITVFTMARPFFYYRPQGLSIPISQSVANTWYFQLFFYFCLILSFGARDGSQGFTHPKQPRLSTCTLSHLSSILHSHIPLVIGVNSNRAGVVSSCGLGFQVSVMRDGEHVCVCLGHLDTFFGEICTQGLCLLWNWAACFVPCSWSSGLIGQIIYKYTMPFQDYAAFHSMDGALWCPNPSVFM